MEPKKSGIVDSEEVERIETLPPGKKHWVRVNLLQLTVGATYRVWRNEWNWKNKTPNVIVKDLQKKTDFRFEFSQATDYSFWLVKRIA